VLLTTGDRLGPYEIQSPLGAGGMGEVYRARDTRLGRDVAIKVLQREFRDAHAFERFAREARAASALSHPNICAVFDIGEADGRPFLVLELIDGRTLREEIGGRPLDVQTALAIGGQIADALETAHARGIVHRDIKSGNVMIAGRRHVKVLDFGLAKQTDAADSQDTPTRADLTMAGIVVGTPSHLSPELLRGAQADTRSDVWALGVVLHEMVTGRLPYEGTTPFAIGEQIARDPLPPLPASVPLAVQQVIERCLAKRPEDRYQTAGDVRSALESVRAALQTNPVPASGPAPRPGGLPRWAWSAIAAVVVASLAAAVWLRLPNPATPPAAGGPPLSSNQRANEAFALALQFLAVQNDVPRGNQALGRAIEIDPQFAEARRLLATNHVILLLNGYTNDTSLLYRAEEELREVAVLNPSLPGLTASFAAVYLSQGRRELVDWARLEREIADDPGNPYSRMWRGIARLMADDPAAAKADFRAILDGQPLFGPARMFYGEALRNEGDLPAAIQELTTVLEQAPNNISAVWWLTLAYLDGGETPKARTLLEQKRQMFAENYFWREAWALLLAAEGQQDAARAALDEDTLTFAAAAFPATSGVAELYALVGDTPKALEWMERTVRNGDERTSYFRRSRRLTSIQGDPRFRGIIESVESRRKAVR
jgi:serine/threonine protein kinase